MKHLSRDRAGPLRRAGIAVLEMKRKSVNFSGHRQRHSSSNPLA
jgi:hypothetical protein